MASRSRSRSDDDATPRSTSIASIADVRAITQSPLFDEVEPVSVCRPINPPDAVRVPVCCQVAVVLGSPTRNEMPPVGEIVAAWALANV